MIHATFPPWSRLHELAYPGTQQKDPLMPQKQPNPQPDGTGRPPPPPAPPDRRNSGMIAHSEPPDPCLGCKHRHPLGKGRAYCTLHVTPRSKCAHYETAPGAAVKTDRLAGGLKWK